MCTWTKKKIETGYLMVNFHSLILAVRSLKHHEEMEHWTSNFDLWDIFLEEWFLTNHTFCSTFSCRPRDLVPSHSTINLWISNFRETASEMKKNLHVLKELSELRQISNVFVLFFSRVPHGPVSNIVPFSIFQSVCLGEWSNIYHFILAKSWLNKNWSLQITSWG